MKNNHYHESVLVNEAVNALHVKKPCLPAGEVAKYIDATAGNGGHILEIVKNGGSVLGIDLDPSMISEAKRRMTEEEIPEGNYKFVVGNFIDINTIAHKNGFEKVSGILFDLGVSNIHLKDLSRGFSFENPESILDMRINPESQGVRACDLLNVLREDQLREMFEVTLDPGSSKWISRRVIHSRSIKPIERVGDMLEICEGLKTGKTGINEATLPFLALRIAVNSELRNLETAMPKAFELLEKKGRLVVISFHSKEDEIVKKYFKEMVGEGFARQVTFKPVMAGESEIQENRRARSAKMRVIEKI